jgi:hypothetical protein
VRRVKDFAAFVGRSPNTASFEDVRGHQLHPAASGVGVPTPEPECRNAARAQRFAARDPHVRTTYYAIDAVNFRPSDLSSALDRLDAPYLPLVTLEAAGLSLDSTFAEQKRIFRRCPGEFYRCDSGAAARRFNRLLIDAGFIKGL